MNNIALIGAPSSAGAYAPGQEKAPSAFRRHGLAPAIEQTGRVVRDMGDVAPFRWRPDHVHPEAMNLEAVRRTAVSVADRVAEALSEGESVLVMGGDCTIELGVVAGALRDEASVGLIYIDGDADLNVPETADGALDWTGVGHLLDLPGALPELSGLGPSRPMLSPADVMLFGAHVITPSEAEVIDALRLEHIPIATVNADAAGAAKRALAWGSKFDRLLVHVDIDVMSFTEFPIAENVRYEARKTGCTLEELSSILAVLLAAPNWRALTLTEINPDHAPDEAETFRRLIDVLGLALSTES
jgi:arginase